MNVQEVLREQLDRLSSGTVGMVYSQDADLLADYVETLSQALTQRENVLLILCDTAGCQEIEDWIYRMSQATLDAAREKGLRVPFREASSDPEDLEKLFKTLLLQRVHIFVIVKHFEQAVSWKSDMAWARVFFSGEFKKNLRNLPAESGFSNIFTADRTISDITGSKPASSSTFANIYYGTTNQLA